MGKGVKVKSIPTSELGYDLLDKLAARHNVHAKDLSEKHVVLISDSPNADQGEVNPTGRTVTMAIICDKPVEMTILGVGSAICSPDDSFDPVRGGTIAFSRATVGMK